MTDHVSVLYQPALEYLAIRPDGIYVDATFGAGGHSRGILERLTTGRLIALDADPCAKAHLPDHTALTFIQANFRQICSILDDLGIPQIDGVLYDLGVSSMQFDQAERGFSFRETAPLDMRMNPNVGDSAYDILSSASESELADIFFYYGQERAARKMPATTTEFAGLVSGLMHRKGMREKIHPATRVFQALRIAVNDELDSLKFGLSDAVGRLRDAGRVVVISFHSLEDRIVKTAFREDERLNVLTRKPLGPTDEETASNPRARSAKLRAAQKKAS